MKVQLKDLTLEQFEDIIVNAMELGSNYWYLVNPIEFRVSLQGKEGDPLSTRIAQTLYNDKTFFIGVYDLEDPSYLLGTLTQESLLKALEIAYTRYTSHYTNFISGNGDAETSDVIFQLAVMGELVFG